MPKKQPSPASSDDDEDEDSTPGTEENTPGTEENTPPPNNTAAGRQRPDKVDLMTSGEMEEIYKKAFGSSEGLSEVQNKEDIQTKFLWICRAAGTVRGVWNIRSDTPTERDYCSSVNITDVAFLFWAIKNYGESWITVAEQPGSKPTRISGKATTPDKTYYMQTIDSLHRLAYSEDGSLKDCYKKCGEWLSSGKANVQKVRKRSREASETPVIPETAELKRWKSWMDPKTMNPFLGGTGLVPI